MTDDDEARARVEAAELRSRIEARVAARRKSSKGSEPDDDEPAEKAPRGPRSLAPTRRWGRPSESETPEPAGESEPAETAEPTETHAPTAKGGGRRRGVEPARPWAGRSDDDSEDVVAPEPEPPANARGRERLKPARRWGRAAAAETPVEAAEASTRTPSNPNSVLRGLEAEAAIASGSASADDFDPDVLPPAEADRRRKLFARRPEDEQIDTLLAAEHAAQQHLDELRLETQRAEEARAEAERLAGEHREVVHRLAAERADAEELLADRRREAERVDAWRVQMERLVEEHRQEAERFEAARASAEQRAAEELAAHRAEAEQVEARRAAGEQVVAQHRQEVEQLAAEQAEVEQLIAQRRAEIGRLEAERSEVERQVSAQRLAAEPLGAAEPAPAGEHVVPITSDRRRRFGRRAPSPGPQPVSDPSADSSERAAEPGYLPEDDAISAYADAAAAAEATAEPVAMDEGVDAQLEPAAVAESDYPWQQEEDVDLDLQGAPTWDPGMYPPEAAGGDPQRTRRALRWLFARTPDEERAEAEPVGEEPTEAVAEIGAAAEPLVEPASAEEPEPALVLEAGSPALVDLELAEALPVESEPMPEEAPAEPEPAVAETPVEQPVAPKESVLTRIFGSRRERAEEPEDVAEEEEAARFPLPAPDAAFEQPWVRTPASPRPTRDWSKPGEPVPAEDLAPADDMEPAAPLAEPEPTPEPEPVAEPVPVTRKPTPGVAAAARRPSPGAASPGRRPSPAASGAPAASRPSPGAVRSRKPMPFELSTRTGAAAPTGRPSPAGRSRQPNLSGFLESSSPERAGDDDEEGDQGGGSRAGRGWRRFFTHGFIWILIAALAALLLRAYVVQPYYIPSASMEPTLHGCPTCDDDHVLVDKISYRIGDVKSKDIVVFHRPKNAHVPDNVLIKRVIGLPKDKISMTRGQVFVNGQKITERYRYKDATTKTCYDTSPDETFNAITVPSGDVFVMGDNRCDSTDSRVFGPIPISSIIGRAFAIIWPVKRIRWLG